MPALGSVGSRRSPPPGDTVGAGTGGAGGCGFSAHPAAAAKATIRIAVEVKRFMHTGIHPGCPGQRRPAPPPWVGRRTKENGGTLSGPAIPCSSIFTFGFASVRQLRRSGPSIGLDHARSIFSLRAPLQSQGPEPRPNQRLNEPLDHLLSVAVGLITAPRHPPKHGRPEFTVPTMPKIAVKVKISSLAATPIHPCACRWAGCG
jgi:hypothetical protein